MIMRVLEDGRLSPGAFLILGTSGDNLADLEVLRPFGVFLSSAFREIPPTRRRAFLRELRSRLPQVWVTTDQEGGYASWLFPHYPSPREVGTLPPHRAQRVLERMARELAAEVEGNFAPVVDRCVPGDPVVSAKGRCFASDPGRVVLYAWMALAAHRRAGVCAVAKHFLAQSLARGDPHVETSVVEASWEVLETDLGIYRFLIQQGLEAVMVGHMIIPVGDAFPVGQSAFWIRRVLRGDLDFPGVVISDDLAMLGAGDLETALERAFFAGVDLFLVVWDEGRFRRAWDVIQEILRTPSGAREARAKFRRLQALRRG